MPRFSVLGPLRAWNGDTELILGPPQQQALLALLLVLAGKPVTISEAIDVLWPDEPPASAVGVVHRYVSQLRRIVGPQALVRSGRAYRLDVPAGALDLHEFRRMLGEAAAHEPADPDRAAARIADGLDLWRGHHVATLDMAVRAAPVFTAIGHEFVAAAVRGAALAATRETAERLIPYLRAVTSFAPLHEPAHAALMRMLALCGRPADALVEFAGLRKRLAAELGVDPGPEVRAVHQQVLAAPAAAAVESVESVAEPPRLWQVAADLAVFTGRTKETAQLAGFLRNGPGTARVAVVSGMGGVGKTTLAVHVAHGLADEFPDGALFADLRGFDPSTQATSADEVLRRFLGELGVAEPAQPAGFDARVALYRSLLAGRRMLIVLDNVRDSAQALPLLPGSRGSAAIVTSRDQLAGLVVGAGALPVPLAPMTDLEAHLYLAQRLGCGRVSGEPGAVRRILAACGGLPLALAIFTARAAGNPRFRLGDLADELWTAQGQMLDRFGPADSGHDLRAVFSWSFDLLTPPAATLFRLLAVHPGATFTTAAAASLLGADDAAGPLAELVRASLIHEVRPGRFELQDLVRAYAAELLAAASTAAAPERAAARLRDYYLQSALAAVLRINPSRAAVASAERTETAGVTPETFPDHALATGWLDREQGALLAAFGEAVAAGEDRTVARLAWAMETFLVRKHEWGTLQQLYRDALEAARRSGEPVMQARLHHGIGLLYSDRGLRVLERSREHFEAAARLFESSGDTAQQVLELVWLGRAYKNPGNEQKMREIMKRAADLGAEVAGGGADDFVAYAYVELGDFRAALRYGLRALGPIRAAGDLHREGVLWTTVGEAYAGIRLWPQAVIANERALLLLKDAGDEYKMLLSLGEMIEQYTSGGRPLLARGAEQRAAVLRARIHAVGRP